MIEQVPLEDLGQVNVPSNNKKNNKAIIIVGFVLILILCIGLVIVLGHKEEQPEETTTTTTTSKETSSSTTTTTTTTTEVPVTVPVLPECGDKEFFIPEINEVNKDNVLKTANLLFTRTYSAMNFYDIIPLNKNGFTKLPNQLKLQLIANAFEHDCYPFTQTNGSVMVYKMSYIFGSKFNIKLGGIVDLKRNALDKNYDCKVAKSCTYAYEYNSGSDFFTKGLSNYMLFIEVGRNNLSKLVSYKEKDGKYIITYKQLFTQTDKGSGITEKTDTHNGGKHFHVDIIDRNGKFYERIPIYINKDNYGDGTNYVIPDSIYNKYKNKIPTTTYTFEVEGNHLILVDYK